MPPAERVRATSQRRSETDYIFEYWPALGWTVLTLGIYGLYVLYQLVRRMREHNIRRLELFDASIAAAWEEAGRRGVQEELRPSFERAAGHLAVLRQMTQDFREPVIWLVLALVARGIIARASPSCCSTRTSSGTTGPKSALNTRSPSSTRRSDSRCRYPTRAG